MAREVSSFQDLGEVVGRRQDEHRAEAQRAGELSASEAVRRRLFATGAVLPKPLPANSKRQAAARWFVAAALVMAALVLLWVRPWAGDALTLVDGDATGTLDASLGTPLHTRTQTRRLLFSDGTEVTLQPHTRARVDHMDARGADVALEHGAMLVSVVHDVDTRWVFHAGGYAVEVTGTRFWLRMNDDKHTLLVDMLEGSVAVSGPGLAAPRRVSAGEQATFRLAWKASDNVVSPRGAQAMPEGSASVKKHGVVKRLPAAATAESGHDDRQAGRAVRSATPSNRASAVEVGGDNWRKLAAAGHYQRAYQLVEGSYSSLVGSLDAASLEQLATVARLSGHGGRARQAYMSLRARFSGTAPATSAAFSLGNLTFGSQSAEAAQWYRRYLAEAPSGGYAAAARGRLLELARRSGNASAAASDYLRHHPDGPHAEMARRAIASESTP